MFFEKGIAHKLDFAYAGSQGKRLAQMVQNGGVELGAIHTYLEMYLPLLHRPGTESFPRYR